MWKIRINKRWINRGNIDKSLQDSYINVFKNIPDDTSEDSYEVPPQKEESNEEDHVWLKASMEDDIEVTSLTHNVKLAKKNEKLEKIMFYLKDYT